MKHYYKIASIVICLGGALGGWYYISSQSQQPNNIYYVSVSQGSIIETLDATGIISPSVGAEVKVGARTTGTVIHQKVKVGDVVAKGDLIAEIDPRELGESLNVALAELDQVALNYPKKIEASRKKVQIAKTAFENAQNNVDYATFVFNQKNELYHAKRRFVSEEEYKKALNALQNANNELKKAQLDRESEELTLQTLENEYLTKKRSQHSLVQQNKLRLEYSRIYAPMSGIVSYVSTQEGETVVAGLNAPEFVKILNPKGLENRIYVDETQIGKIHVGQNVEFTLDTYKDKIFKGKVSQIYPTPTLQNNIVYFTVVVANFDGVELLKSSMTTHNTLYLREKKQTLLVPNNAVKWKNGRFVVTVKRHETPIEQEVKVGISDQKNTEILSGLHQGETLVIMKNLPKGEKEKL